jgi:SAM-dependent methyltransferase
MPYSDVLDHADSAEHERLRALAAGLDPGTIRRLERLGPRPGWRCLDIGAGTGSVARWLARACPGGEVVATDLDLRFLEPSDGIRVLRHDVCADDFPAGSFDLIVARLVFMHLPDREETLAKVVRWLAPGGWLLLEDGADLAAGSSPSAVHRKLAAAAWQTMLEVIGTDPRWARSFPRPLAELGLEQLGIEGELLVIGPGTGFASFFVHTLRRLADPILAAGRATEDEIDAVIADWYSDRFIDLAPMSMVAAWGRKA